jgi:hypothetical protein
LYYAQEIDTFIQKANGQIKAGHNLQMAVKNKFELPSQKKNGR